MCDFFWGGYRRHSRGAAARLCASKPARALRILRYPPHRWGLVCCCVGEPRLCLAFGTKFSLLGFLVVRTVQNSPCMSKKRQIEPFRVSRESFIPEMRRGRACRESFIPEMRRGRVCGESFVPKRRGVVLVGRDLFRRGTFRVCSCRVSATHRCPILTLPPLQRAPHWWRWGFCTTRSLLAACRRRVGPPCSAIPPRLVAARPRFEAVRSPKCRPIG